MPPPLIVAALSHRGLMRRENQDFAYAGEVPGAEGWQLLAVADGVGGHARGEWASQRAVQLVANGLAGLLADRDPADALREAVTMANAQVHHEARAIGCAGAATTFAAALVRDGQAWWVNVGDSRVYALAGGRLRQLSADHSWVAEQVRAGAMRPDDARTHGKRNVVTRTVGFEPYVLPDVDGPVALGPGDALLLCSDGLHGPVDETCMQATAAELDPQFAVGRLVELANEAGGPDNITVVIGRVIQEPEPAAETNIVDTVRTEPPPRKRRRRRWLFPLISGLMAVAGGGGATAAALVFFA